MNNIRNEVNDNDSRVRAIETQTSNLANGCLANEYIQAIAKNGDLSCEEIGYGHTYTQVQYHKTTFR